MGWRLERLKVPLSKSAIVCKDFFFGDQERNFETLIYVLIMEDKRFHLTWRPVLIPDKALPLKSHHPM